MTGATAEAALIWSDVYRKGWRDGYREVLDQIGMAADTQTLLDYREGGHIERACMTDERARQACCWEVEP